MSVPKLPFRVVSAENPYKVLFVCLGNICRSPTGEGIFIHKIKQAGLEHLISVDSAGTAAFHVGEPAHKVSQLTANKHGVHLPSVGRQFVKYDFEDFDVILAMDRTNRNDIMRLARSADDSGNVFLMRDFDVKYPGTDVPDPYYGGIEGFEGVFNILNECSEALLNAIKSQILR